MRIENRVHINFILFHVNREAIMKIAMANITHSKTRVTKITGDRKWLLEQAQYFIDVICSVYIPGRR